jgi:hypothetical protein
MLNNDNQGFENISTNSVLLDELQRELEPLSPEEIEMRRRFPDWSHRNSANLTHL